MILKIKKVLQTAQPSEYMGQDFTKLGDLLTELQDLDVNKSDKKMMKKLFLYKNSYNLY